MNYRLITMASELIQHPSAVEGAPKPSKPAFVRGAARWALPLLMVGSTILAVACNKDAKASQIAPIVEPSPTAVPTLTSTPEPTETPTIVPVTPTKEAATPTQEALKVLPKVIDKEMVVARPANEVDKEIQQALAEGKYKITLPDLAARNDISTIVARSPLGTTVLAFAPKSTSNTEGGAGEPAPTQGKFDVSAPTGGKVVRKQTALNVDTLTVMTNENFGWAIAIPPKSSFAVNEGDTLTTGQIFATINYQPNSSDVQAFKKTIIQNTLGAPENALAILAIGSGTSVKGIDLKIENVVTYQGQLVTIALPK